jgi:DNA modification methylase
MPVLQWAGKDQEGAPGQPFDLESIVYPSGNVTPDFDVNGLALGDNLSALIGPDGFAPGILVYPTLVYVDPPFFTNHSFQARSGHGEDSRRPEAWRLAAGYNDCWKSLDEYLTFLYQRFKAIHRVLAETGTLYVHLDWHADAYARLILDEIFGPDHLLNEIVWTYTGPSPIHKAFSRKHDLILAYTKSDHFTFNADDVRVPYDPATLRAFHSAKAGFGKVPDLARGKVPEDYWHFPVVARLHNERTGYPTQKPEALLERIIRASSNPGDLVWDLFCGSGTTAAVASRLGRKFFSIDTSPLAILTARARLLKNPLCPSFATWVESGRQFPNSTDANLQYSREGDDLVVTCEKTPLILVEAGDMISRWTIFRSLQQSVPDFRRPNSLRLKGLYRMPGPCSFLRVTTADGEVQFASVFQAS